MICKNNDWFNSMYNLKLEDLHADNYNKGGSILNYISYDKFIKEYNNNNYYKFNIQNISFLSFYGNNFNESIFLKIIEDIDNNFDNKNYSYKDSLLYTYLKENKINTLSEYFKLNKPNNLQKYSKFYEFYPWDKNFTIKYDKFCGVLDDSFIDLHFIKIKRCLEGIKKYGIKYNQKNMISGFILSKNKNNKFIVTSGIHRIMVIKYLFKINKLNTNIVICKVNNTINLFDINNWVHVKNNFISKENAEKIFNFLFID